jgi:hypothetical protein
MSPGTNTNSTKGMSAKAMSVPFIQQPCQMLGLIPQ